MGYASRSGRARTNPTRPCAFAVCDRCGRWYNHPDLQWARDFRGPRLQNLGLLVCGKCQDVPQNQLRPIVTGPDPVPIRNPRPEAFAADDAGGVVEPATVREILEL